MPLHPVFFRLSLTALLLAAVAPPLRADEEDPLWRAAQGGQAQAQVRLAYALRDGKDRPRSPELAARWFGLAAAQGDLEAIDNLGWLHERGLGLSADPKQAKALYARAAEGGWPQAQYNLGRCLEKGIGGPPDPGAAMGWYAKAVHSRHGPAAAHLLALVVGGRPWAGLADALGEMERLPNPECQWQLGLLYFSGAGGVAPDQAKAAACFARARAAGRDAECLDPLQVSALTGRPAQTGVFGFIPLRHQDQGLNMCAPTSSAMVLARDLGRAQDPYAVKKHCPDSPVGTGTGWDKLLVGVRETTGRQWAIRTFAFDDGGFTAGLALLHHEVDQRRPVLVDVRLYGPRGPAHTVVVCGYDAVGRRVLIQDPAIPAPGVRSVAEETFKTRWNSQWFMPNPEGTVMRPLILTGKDAAKQEK